MVTERNLSALTMAVAGRVPDLRFLLAHPAHLIACGFGSGLSPVAPGTFGTLFAWVSFPLLAHGMSEGFLLGFLAFAYLSGILICERTGRALGIADHSAIVWDEIVPFWLVLALTPAGWLWQLTAFCLFRFFDIAKPPPADYFDREVKNGFGVMTDDVVAAGYTLVVIAILKRIID